MSGLSSFCACPVEFEIITAALVIPGELQKLQREVQKNATGDPLKLLNEKNMAANQRSTQLL